MAVASEPHGALVSYALFGAVSIRASASDAAQRGSNERCRLGSAGGIRSYVRFARTNPSGCSAVEAHLLWEPFVPERCRLCASQHEIGERKTLDYCAFRSLDPGRAATHDGAATSGGRYSSKCAPVETNLR